MWRWYLGPWRKYAEFTGRATRREFWAFTVGNLAAFIALLACVGFVTGASTPASGGADADHASSTSAHPTAASVLIGLVILGWMVTLLPALAVGCRRLHDIGRSGALQLVALIPFVGPPLLFIFNVLPGNVGPNRYGPDPRSSGYDGYLGLSGYPSPGSYPPAGWSRSPSA